MPPITTNQPDRVEAHILVVDDDVAIRELIKEYLTENDFKVSVAETGADMDRVLAAEMVDLVLLDLKLPDEDGLAIARRLRESLDIPIIILTGRKEEVDRVMGLELGADDYVTKPFSQRELLARIKAVLRRTEGKRATRRGETVRAYRFSGWELNTGTRKLRAPDGRTVELTNSEYALLVAFLKAPQRILVARPAARVEPAARRHLRPLHRRADPAPAAQGRGKPQPAHPDPHRARRRLLPRLDRRDRVSVSLLAIDGVLIVVAAWLVIGVAGIVALRSFAIVAGMLFPLSALLSIAMAAIGLAALPGTPEVAVLPIGLPDLPFHLRLDALSAFFLMLLGRRERRRLDLRRAATSARARARRRASVPAVPRVPRQHGDGACSPTTPTPSW